MRDVRLRADELDARRGVPVRARATARWSTSAARPPTSACSQHGFPREAAVAVDIGGVRTNFRMPDVLSLGLGGGSLVRDDGAPRSGPRSVGYELTRRALVFGGDTLTATDIAVAAGRARRSATRAASRELDPSARASALARIEERIAEVVDRMKTSADPMPVVVVGGGSVLLGDALPGAVASSIKPRRTSRSRTRSARRSRQVGGEVDRVFSLDERSARRGARRGQARGASSRRDGGRRRARTRSRSSTSTRSRWPTCRATRRASASRRSATSSSGGRPLRQFTEARPRRPRRRRRDPRHRRRRRPLHRQAAGAGGDRASTARSTIVDVDEVPDDALVVPSAMMGAPTVMVEKMPSGDEAVRAFEALQEHLGRDDHAHDVDRGRRAELDDAVHRGGAARASRSSTPTGWAARSRRCRWSRRRSTASRATPMALADEKGNRVAPRRHDRQPLDRALRALDRRSTWARPAMVAQYALTGPAGQARRWCRARSRLAEELGAARARGARARTATRSRRSSSASAGGGCSAARSSTSSGAPSRASRAARRTLEGIGDDAGTRARARSSRTSTWSPRRDERGAGHRCPT